MARAVLESLPEPDADPGLSVDQAHPAFGIHPVDREHPAADTLRPDDLLAMRGAVLLGLGIAALELGQADTLHPMEVAYEALQSALPLTQRSGHRYGALSCLYYLMRTQGCPWIDDARGALSQRSVESTER